MDKSCESVSVEYRFSRSSPYTLSDFDVFHKLLERESAIYGIKASSSELAGTALNIKRLLDKWNMGGLPELIVKDF